MINIEGRLGGVLTGLDTEMTEAIGRIFNEADMVLVGLGESLCPGARFPMKNTEPIDPVVEAEAFAKYKWGENNVDAVNPTWWTEEILGAICVTDGRKYYTGCTDPDYPGHVQQVYVTKDESGQITDVGGISVPYCYKNLGPLLPGYELYDEDVATKQVFWS